MATQTNGMTMDQILAEIERLKAQNEELKKKSVRQGTLSLKISEKGALCVYGLGRFPVTLYWEQWTRLLEMAEEIKSFIAANRAKLKSKGEEKVQ